MHDSDSAPLSRMDARERLERAQDLVRRQHRAGAIQLPATPVWVRCSAARRTKDALALGCLVVGKRKNALRELVWNHIVDEFLFNMIIYMTSAALLVLGVVLW